MPLNLPDKRKTTNTQSYTDEQVMAAVISEHPYHQLVLKWFLPDVREYALGYWRKQYGRLREEEWEVIFANTNLKFITRIKNGLELRPETRLKTYYTAVVGYAILDFLESKRKKTFSPSVQPELEETTSTTDHLEKAQMAALIKEVLEQITGNVEQVKVILLFTKGYSYKEIVEKTNYKSEGACRNAFLNGKKKITEYILENPQEGKRLKEMIVGAG